MAQPTSHPTSSSMPNLPRTDGSGNNANVVASPAISSGTNTPALAPRHDLSIGTAPSPSHSHRASFAENLRYPPSPRAQRHLSFSGAALTELLLHPPVKGQSADGRFAGRDWRAIQVHEIVDPDEVRFVELDTSIEDTTKLLVRSGAPNIVLVRESRRTRTPIGIFGYDDLNAYLLLVLGMTQPDGQAARVAERARNGEVLPLKDIRDHLGSAAEPLFLPHTADLTKAMEVLGSGAHRVVLCKEGTSEAVGVLSQLRLVRFFWENHQGFASTEQLYSRTLQDLRLGAKEVISINGDRPLSEALRIMHEEGITSLPVLDNQSNVIGNISHVDVRLLTDTSAIPLLSSSCMHFVSVILSERGLEDGKDSYPVHHVTSISTLAQTVAKLSATRSHRMWIVDAPSPASSIPPSPSVAPYSVSPFGLQQTNGHPTSTPSMAAVTATATTRAARAGSGSEITAGAPFTSAAAHQPPGVNLSGRLSGVISLTDVLNLLARASGLRPADPEETRRRRRRSSSSSSRPHLDLPSSRPSSEALRNSIELGRSGSQSRR